MYHTLYGNDQCWTPYTMLAIFTFLFFKTSICNTVVNYDLGQTTEKNVENFNCFHLHIMKFDTCPASC